MLSLEEAGSAIQGMRVRVGGAVAMSPAHMVLPGDAIEVEPETFRYVSRGGIKLEHALDAFCVSPVGQVCLDAGASTGGFTDCLLRRGALKVYAIDVGRGQLHSRIAADDRVVAMEQRDIRDVKAAEFDEAPSLITADVAFIGLSKIVPSLVNLAAEDAELILLVKPQFEAARGDVEPGGLVTSSGTHRSVLVTLEDHARTASLVLLGLVPSPLLGPAGNVEFLGRWQREGAVSTAPPCPERLIADAVDEAHQQLIGERRT